MNHPYLMHDTHLLCVSKLLTSAAVPALAESMLVLQIKSSQVLSFSSLPDPLSGAFNNNTVSGSPFIQKIHQPPFSTHVCGDAFPFAQQAASV